ncbi:granulocyte-macrophage colony-stimulating factor receptor subunit alpha-like [Trichomycterus rosablanca]|uniref:granulocyte-macrophage colony-stimulating factor receptor subunit alpha-like n=1 Tax=Trichomycterus rosablanca TaxID=2290929 RepID=UPI002F357ECF
MEKVVAFLPDNNLYEPFQSGFRSLHSTDTALLRVNDLLLAADVGYINILVLLDLSAAFDTLNHTILPTHLLSIGITGTALAWFHSYPTDRQQFITIDELPQPENLSLSWNPNSLSLTAQWNRPTNLDADCEVKYVMKLYYEKCPPKNRKPKEYWRTKKLNFTLNIDKEDELCVGVMTEPQTCENKNLSKPVYKGLSPPLALVNNFSCVYYADKRMNCTWTLVSNISDLQLFYRNLNETKDMQKSCTLYITNGNSKTGCHIHDDLTTESIYIVFTVSGTVKGLDTQNIFEIKARDSVKPPTPELEIRLEDRHLLFNSSTPDFGASHCWQHKYYYSKCNEEKKEQITEGGISAIRLEYDEACRYTVQVETIYSHYCGEVKKSAKSQIKYYGKDCDPNMSFKVIMIVMPILVSWCLIVALLLFRRNKDIICPVLPHPTLLLFKDILNTNYDGFSKDQTKDKIYVPVKEIVANDVHLEPLSAFLHPNRDV